MAHAQGPDIHFEPVKAEGLSNANLRCALQDKQGFMWFGTDDGLIRYDAYQTEVFRPPADSLTLPQFRINLLREDAAGKLWLGTSGEGLVRFDPETRAFAFFRHNPDNPNSLSHDYVRGLHIDQTGVIWIGTMWGGLNRFDPATGEFRNFLPNPEGEEGRFILTLYEAPSQPGKLWIGTLEHGLYSFDTSAFEFEHFPADPARPDRLANDRVTDVFEDSRGKLWIRSVKNLEDDLQLLDVKTGRFEQISPPKPATEWNVHAIYEDRFGALWMTSGKGFYYRAPDADTFHLFAFDTTNPSRLHKGQYRSIMEDHTGNLWFVSQEGAVYHCYPGPSRVLHYTRQKDQDFHLPYDLVYSVGEDATGNIWLGLPDGVVRLEWPGGKIQYYKDFLTSEDTSGFSRKLRWIKAIHTDREERLWLGLAEPPGGMIRLDAETGAWRFFPGPSVPGGVNIRSILEGRDGFLYLGLENDGQVIRWDPSGLSGPQVWSPPEDYTAQHPNIVYSLYEDQEGFIWAGTGLRGLKKMDPSAGEVVARFRHDPEEPESLSSDHVQVLFEDSYGRLWIGTKAGLNLYDPSSNTFRQIKDPLRKRAWDVRSILEDASGDLWLSTSTGISVVHAPPGGAPSFRHYRSLDGEELNNADFSVGAGLKTRDGALVFGSERAGLFIFYPERIDIPPPPEVVFTDFRLFNESVPHDLEGDAGLTQPIDVAEEITLSYRDRVLTFEFAALGYNDSEGVEYAYWLEGFDKEWQYIGNKREVTFTNLRPGNYTLRVKATNYAGIWNEKGRALGLTILPLWWQTGWARVLGLLLLVGMAIGFVFYRTYRIRRKNAELERMVEERTRDLSVALENLKATQAELVKSEKLALLGRLMANVAHEINNPLGAIGASRENIEHAYGVLVDQFPKLITALSEERLRQFFSLLNEVEENTSSTLSGLGQFREKRALRKALEEMGVSQPEIVADTLADMGVQETMIRPYAGLLRAPQQERILSCLYSLFRLKLNSKNIKDAVDRSSKVLFALKSYSAGKNGAEYVPVDVPDSLDSILTLYQNQLNSRIELIREYQEVPRVLAKRDELNQVWTNIILNALQAMNYSGKLEITVRSEQRKEPGGATYGELKDFVVVSITDNGPGIPAKDLPQIFEPFFTTKAMGEGSGLGLDITRSIVEDHRGTIIVDSRPGRTTFEVWLPVDHG